MIELKVEGMHCGGCVASVSRALKALDQAAELEIDLPSGQVRIKSAQLDRDQASQAIEDAGFEVVG